MQSCYLVINRDTQLSAYLEHRSILSVVSEHRSLGDIDLNKLDIVDVDKFLYIYYGSDDNDLNFRQDMNVLRNLLKTAFFHVNSITFIIVNSANPILEDLIHAALRDTDIGSDILDIIHHNGNLMLSDVGTYVTGSVSGNNYRSSYKNVYIREADKEEKERFSNTTSDLRTSLPVLTDMFEIYKQRSRVEATSANKVISEQSVKPQIIKGFSTIEMNTNSTMQSYVVSGDNWTELNKMVEYIVNYNLSIGKRVLCVLLDLDLDLSGIECSILGLNNIRNLITPEYKTAVIKSIFSKLAYIIQFIDNIKGIDKYIFVCSKNNFSRLIRFIKQLSDYIVTSYIGHYSEESVLDFISLGVEVNSLFLTFSKFNNEFNLKKYKDVFYKTIVALFPLEDVDYIEFHNLLGGSANE